MYIRIKATRGGYRVQLCYSNHRVQSESGVLRQFRSAVFNAKTLAKHMKHNPVIWLPSGECCKA